MRRLGALALVAAISGLVVLGRWASAPLPAVGEFDPSSFRAVEVSYHPWGEDGAAAPGASTADPAAVAELVAVLRAGVPTPQHKCGPRGEIRLRRQLARPVVLEFLPGHHPDWYEFVYDREAYKVPRPGFVAAMRRVGTEVPLECP